MVGLAEFLMMSRLWDGFLTKQIHFVTEFPTESIVKSDSLV